MVKANKKETIKIFLLVLTPMILLPFIGFIVSHYELGYLNEFKFYILMIIFPAAIFINDNFKLVLVVACALAIAIGIGAGSAYIAK